MTNWQPYREPLLVTLMRTGAIAVVVGAVTAKSFDGEMRRWPVAMLLVLWPSLAGHWVEVWFLNRLRPRLPDARAVQAGMRIGVWFVAGIIFALAMGLTATALGARPPRWHAWGPPWWIGGLGFVGVELIAHVVLQLCGRPSFYNGRG